MSKTFKYGELFLNAEHGETYEIVDCNVGQLIGKKVTMKKTGAGNLIMKKEGTIESVDIDDIVTPFGGITGATYKKVAEYKKVDVGYALESIADGQDVFVKEEHFDGDDSYTRIDETFFLDALGITDIDDLIKKEFYITK